MVRKYLLVVLMTTSWSTVGPAKPKFLPDANSIIDLTRDTTATYSAYSITDFRDPIVSQDQTAEFHSGYLHRVETPHARVVANCATGEGHYLNLDDDTITSNDAVALSACGIDANRKLFSRQLIGIRSTKFGKAWRLVLTDAYYIRGYDVNENGIIVGAFMKENKPGQKLLLVQKAYKVTATMPAKDMFSTKSLRRSFLPQ